MPHVIRTTVPAARWRSWAAGRPGSEAARVTAARGHEVVLHEATDRLGGQVVLAARLDRRREIIGITDWLARAEARHHGADPWLNSYLETDDILAEARMSW